MQRAEIHCTSWEIANSKKPVVTVFASIMPSLHRAVVYVFCLSDWDATLSNGKDRMTGLGEVYMKQVKKKWNYLT